MKCPDCGKRLFYHLVVDDGPIPARLSVYFWCARCHENVPIPSGIPKTIEEIESYIQAAVDDCEED